MLDTCACKHIGLRAILFYLYLLINVNEREAAMGLGQTKTSSSQTIASCPASKATKSSHLSCKSVKPVTVQTPPQKAASSGSTTSVQQQKKKASPPNSISGKAVSKAKVQSPPPVQATAGKKLTPFLKHVEADLTLKVNETRNNVKIMERLVQFLMEQMKAVDELFAYLYRNIFYTGSYYDGLRITSASEFDLNIVLALPYKSSDRDVQAESNCPAYAKYSLRTSATMETMSKKPPAGLVKFFDEKNFLLPEKIRSWLQSVLDKALVKRKDEIDKFCQDNLLKELKPKQSGPARTLLIRTQRGGEIDIDLVPVIEFHFPEWPKGAEKHVKLDHNNGIWFLVPKPYFKSSSPLEPKDVDVPRLWRLHFPLIEREVLHNRGYVKPLIKFLKKLRDEEDWKILASYYLKTFVMREILSSKAEKWSGELGDLFLELLRKLSKKVKDGNLEYLFYSKYNLLHSMSQVRGSNISHRIEKIIAAIEKDPRAVLGYLGCTCEHVLETL